MPYLHFQPEPTLGDFGRSSGCQCKRMKAPFDSSFGEPNSTGEFPEEERKMIWVSASQAGVRTVNKLSDQVFFARHPDRNGRLIDPRTEPELATEWKNIKGRLVLPILDAIDSNEKGKEAMYANLYLRAMRFFDRARRISVSPAELRAKATFNLGTANFQLKRFAAVIGYMEIVRTWKGTSKDLKDLRDKAERLFLKAKEEYSKAVPTT